MKQTLNICISLLLFILGFQGGHSQDSLLVASVKIDSLKQLIINHNKQDEEKVRLLNEYARTAFYEMDFMEGLKATHEAHKLSEDLDFEGGIIMYYLTLSVYCGNGRLGSYYRKQAESLSLQPGKKLEKYYSELPIPPNNEGSLENWLNRSSELYTYFEQLDAKEIQAIILYDIIYYHAWLNNNDEALKACEKGIKLFDELNQPYPVFLIMSTKMGLLNDIGRKEEASLIEAELIEFIAKNKNTNAIGLITSSMAYGYRISGRHMLAIEYYLQAIEEFEKNNDSSMLAYCYNSIAFEYAHLEMFDKSVEMHEKNIIILKQQNDTERLISSYNSAAFPNFYTKNYDKARAYMELALQTTNKQQQIYFQARQKSLEGQILMDQEQYAAAIPFFQSALQTYLEHNQVSSIPFAYVFLARCYYNLEDYPKALENALLCLKNENEYNRGRVRVKKEITLLIAEIYNKIGQQGNAYRYMKMHHEIRDESDKLDATNRLADARIISIIEKSQNKIDAIEKEKEQSMQQNRVQRLWLFSIAGGLLSAILILFILYRNNKSKQKANTLLNKQKEEIEQQKNIAENTLAELKVTQNQLIQSEKMASLGELTAGIAHEIQNPLNFVNNFSEVSNELIDEMNEEIEKEDFEEAKAIAADIKQNLEKINHHGKRADAIVKGMLQHSRSSSTTKEPTDINKLADEYLRLAYHGLRAKDKTFNATLNTDFDESIGNIKVFPQDIGRVILNLITNAFYAVTEKKKQHPTGYEPTVTIITKKTGQKVTILVKDNGNGIPKHILDKIFQPFFTTKPTGKGTGLGLSLSYDIIKAHNGELNVETKEQQGTTFTIVLPNA
jgi:signal transduction histidine kinase